jgi:hypothetical protein
MRWETKNKARKSRFTSNVTTLNYVQSVLFRCPFFFSILTHFIKLEIFPPPSNTSLYHSHSLIGKVTICNFFCYMFSSFKHTKIRTTNIGIVSGGAKISQGEIRYGVGDKIERFFFHFGRREVATPIGTETSGSDNLNLSVCLCFFKSGELVFSTTVNKKKLYVKTTTLNATI